MRNEEPFDAMQVNIVVAEVSQRPGTTVDEEVVIHKEAWAYALLGDRRTAGSD
jgi:hypothetical protein